MDLSLQAISKESKRQLSLLLKEQKRRRGKKDLWFLCKHVLGYNDLTDEDRFHGKYCRHLDNEKYRFKLSLTPRGSLKTSIGTIGGTIKDILNDPNSRTLIASKKWTFSTQILGEIKGHFEKNEVFRDTYGDWVGGTWSKHEIIVNKRTRWRAQPTVACAGVDVTTVGTHYDVIRLDDPHDEINTMSQEQIDKVIRWYRLLLSLLDPGGKLYVTGTIWHYNDLFQHIISMERARLEAGRKKRFKIFKRDSFKGSNEELMNNEITKDKLLWPERLSVEFLQDQYIEQGPYIFSCQYRLNPIDDDSAIFKRSWIKTCDPSEIPNINRLNRFSVVDPMVDEEGKDFLAIVTVGVDPKWNFYLLDVRRKKADEHDTVDEMYEVHRLYRPQKIGFETVSFQETYMRYIQMLTITRGYRLPIRQLKTSTRVSKPKRIKSMVPWWKAGLFIIPCPGGDLSRLTGNMATLVDELTRYPKTANDDTIDALAYITQLANCPNILTILKRRSPKSFHAIRERLIKPKRHHKLGARNVRSGKYATV